MFSVERIQLQVLASCQTRKNSGTGEREQRQREVGGSGSSFTASRLPAPACLLTGVRADKRVHKFMLALACVCRRETLGGELQAGRKRRQLDLARSRQRIAWLKVEPWSAFWAQLA
jgi:hypothetical protein